MCAVPSKKGMEAGQQPPLVKVAVCQWGCQLQGGLNPSSMGLPCMVSGSHSASKAGQLAGLDL